MARGALFGRFDGEDIAPLSDYWGTQLALRSARYYGVDLPELMAPVLANRCGGNPFYITAVIRQAVKSQVAIPNEERLNELLAVDISSGFIWGELHDQVSRWIQRINDYGITKWVLYLSALAKEDKIHVEQIQQELKERDGKDVPLDTVRDILVKLSRGDLIDYLELGGWFRKVNDPILLEFLKVWGRIEVEGQSPNTAQYTLVDRYTRFERRVNEYKGYLAEVFMSQVLLSGQSKTFPGRLFHYREEELQMPFPFFFVYHRRRLSSGKGREIDLIGGASGELWVCQSIRVTTDPVGPGVLDELLAQAEMAKAELDPSFMRLWLFAYRGLTKKAAQIAEEQGILWSDKEDLNALLRILGLRELPKFDAE